MPPHPYATYQSFPHSAIFPETFGDPLTLTNVEDPLFSCVLPGMPVFPVFQLFVSVFILTENNHDHTLRKSTELALVICN